MTPEEVSLCPYCFQATHSKGDNCSKCGRPKIMPSPQQGGNTSTTKCPKCGRPTKYFWRGEVVVKVEVIHLGDCPDAKAKEVWETKG